MKKTTLIFYREKRQCLFLGGVLGEYSRGWRESLKGIGDFGVTRDGRVGEHEHRLYEKVLTMAVPNAYNITLVDFQHKTYLWHTLILQAFH